MGVGFSQDNAASSDGVSPSLGEKGGLTRMRDDRVSQELAALFSNLDLFKDGLVNKYKSLELFDIVAFALCLDAADITKRKKECGRDSKRAHKLDFDEFCSLFKNLDVDDEMLFGALQIASNRDPKGSKGTTPAFESESLSGEAQEESKNGAQEHYDHNDPEESVGVVEIHSNVVDSYGEKGEEFKRDEEDDNSLVAWGS